MQKRALRSVICTLALIAAPLIVSVTAYAETPLLLAQTGSSTGSSTSGGIPAPTASIMRLGVARIGRVGFGTQLLPGNDVDDKAVRVNESDSFAASPSRILIDRIRCGGVSTSCLPTFWRGGGGRWRQYARQRSRRAGNRCWLH